MKKGNLHDWKKLYSAAAAIAVAAAVFASPVRVQAWTDGSPLPDPAQIVDQITSPSEKQKLREALEELDYRGLTPRAVLESVTGEGELSFDSGTAGQYAQQIEEQAAGIMEDASQNISENLRRNFLQSLLDVIREKLEEVF